MKSAAVLLVLSLAPAWAQLPRPPAATPPVVAAPTEKPRVSRQTLTDLEKHLNTSLASLGGANDPLDVLGAARGIYLDGYGVVFTAEASLIFTPTINPFHMEITEAEKVKVHQRKLDRLPMLKQLMREMWRDSAVALTAIPDNQQVVVAVRLLYLPWEDTRGLPGQIVVKGARRAALTGAVQTEEQ